MEDGQGAAGKSQDDARPFIHPGRPDVGQARDPIRRPQQPVGERDGIDSDVEERAAAERRVEKPPGRVEIGPEAEARLDHLNVADRPLRDQPPKLQGRGEEPGPHRLHQKELLRPGRRDHAPGLGRVDGERLFAEDGLPGLEAEKGVVMMEIVRRADVYDVDVRIPRQGLVGGMAMRNVEPPAEPFGRVPRPRSDGHEFGPGNGPKPPGEGRGDVSGAENPPADFLGHVVSP